MVLQVARKSSPPRWKVSHFYRYLCQIRKVAKTYGAGFNFDNDLVKFTCYAAFLVDGNLITDKLSIGGKTHETGPDPPSPATVGGLNTHNVFEGDTSMT
jgi:hypothetical protein